ncbi:MAG: sigma-54-dependent Fis family transcriptional regulator [Deltaproteobacteria bacterium]|nr:sigma-54-dependent Fis family transcriptional regulator [Deltaproteobacteria bacterium]
MSVFGTIRVLVVDDEESIRRLAEKELASPRRIVKTADCATRASQLIRQESFDVVVLDIRLPDGCGIDLFEQFREIIPGVEIILITGHGNVENAVEAMKMGAYDYITKPFSLDRLELVIEKAYQRVCLTRENRLLRHNQSCQPLSRFVGLSSAMQEIQYLIQKVAPTNAPVLITGESGVGKDVVARAIHSQSKRAQQPLIIKNCGTLQKDLMRSELFGHAKGSFTGATESKEGLIDLAHQGSLFLDEIGELPLEVQASLLRLLENSTYRRVGEKYERKVDIRFLFATNRNLPQEIKAGNFHEALYHRLNIFPVHIPPLRERKEDIPVLVEYFLGLLGGGRSPCRMSKSAMEYLISYDWPGNVRELRNVVERGIILCENGMITPKDLPREMLMQQTEGTTGSDSLLTLEELQKSHIRRVLDHAAGNRSRAADLLGIGRKTLYRKMKEYGFL